MKIIGFIIFLLLSVVPFHVFADGFLSGDTIKSTFEGNTYHWKHMKVDTSGKSYLDPSGKAIGERNGKARKGTWKIVSNQICIKYDEDKQPTCRNIEKDQKDGTFYIIHPSKGRLVQITSVESGNTI
ncbi:MAG: hypothetical protein WBW79_11605 [Desulfocapsaceae bacterium]